MKAPASAAVTARQGETDQEAAVMPSGPAPDSGVLLWQHSAGWTLIAGQHRREFDHQAEPAALVATLSEWLQTDTSIPRRCVLALAATECFFVNLPRPDELQLKDRTALAFELERVIPLDAESMVVAARGLGEGERLAALVVNTDRLRGLAEAIESASLDVVAIVPAAFLIARAVQRTSQFHGPFRLLLTHDGATEDLTVDAAGVGQWKHYHDFEELRCNRALIEDAETPRPETVAVGDFGGAWAGALPATRCEASAITLLVQGAELALAGQWRSWPNLRQDGLAAQDPLAAVAKPLRRLAFAAALCFVALIIAARYRGWRIETASRSLQAQQRAAFRETFPSRRVPVLLMRTIRREHQRTIGSRATGGEIDLPTPAVKVLAGLLDGLQGARQQGAARFRVIDLNITDGECGLTVRARNAVQLGTIAKALESAGFAVEPPAAEQIAANETEPIATFQSTLSARWRDGGGDDTAADAPPRAAAGGPR